MAKRPEVGGPDIQLEHGHVRIVNPVVEALALAPFNAGQLKVMIAVIRETWGWRRKQAEVSSAGLAEATGLARSTAAAALRDLVEEGALEEVARPTFTRPGTYQVQKNPARWGRFAVSPPALSGVPDTPADRTLRNGAPETPEDRTPLSGRPDTPAPEAVGTPAGSAPLKTDPKDRKDIHPPSDPDAAVPPELREEVASAVIRIANRGMADNPGIGTAMTPIPTSHGSRTEVLTWLQEGIPRSVIEAAVYSTAEAYKPAPPRNRQISTMKYFTGAVHDEWDRHQAENSEAPDVEKRSGRNGGGARPQGRGGPRSGPGGKAGPRGGPRAAGGRG